MYSLN